jgi:hypothetical protein
MTWRRSGTALLIGVALTACAAWAGSSRSVEARAAATPFDLGKHYDVGRTWPAGRVKAGMLLEDDGTTLWSVKLDGARQALWKHRHAEVAEISASPDGRELAYLVEASNDGIVYWSRLYLLGADGRIRVIADTKLETVTTPVFLAPVHARRPMLYWFQGDTLNIRRDNNRPGGRIMMLPTGGPPTPVVLPLRDSEAAYSLFGYPGDKTFNVELFRTSNVPTHMEMLQSDDWLGLSTAASPTRFSVLEHDEDTDSLQGAAWLTPRRFVVHVAVDQTAVIDRSALVLHDVGCPWDGGKVIYRGDDLPWGPDLGWQLLPYGTSSVLAVRQASPSAPADFVLIDVGTGAVTPTRVPLPTTGSAAYTFVQPAAPISPKTPPDACDGFENPVARIVSPSQGP